jgi:hypothetical protein
MLSLIAGIGVLLLAMGVGVLIGRSDSPKQSAAPAQVISVNSAPGAGAGTSAEAAFSDDWPAGSSGYSDQLQTLPVGGTSVAAVAAAKAAASSKGAAAVGALKSEDFSSLPGGDYVIYSGDYPTRSAAAKALGALKKSFPSASVIRVSNPSSSSGSTPASAGAAGGAVHPSVPSSETHPAPPSALKGLENVKGKSYEEKSKNLPNVVETP